MRARSRCSTPLRQSIRRSEQEEDASLGSRSFDISKVDTHFEYHCRVGKARIENVGREFQLLMGDAD